ncbi:hypothetical protein BYT27DRAFT_7245517 [Phlegmacium glaucopus]|nr:hypothetical protein BYT27DRAFT_7245517 [Phlegmacium glaucopus]
MHLYNLTLQPPTSITQAIVGNFSGARQQEIIVSHGIRLELLRPDVQTGKVSTVIATDAFGSIRSLAVFRLTGGTKVQGLSNVEEVVVPLKQSEGGRWKRREEKVHLWSRG